MFVLISCFNGKRQKAEVNDDGDTSRFSINKVIDYDNYYKDDTLIKTEVTYYRNLKPLKKEQWVFDYDEKNQRIRERHFLYTGEPDSLELVYEEKVSKTIEQIIEFKNSDTINMKRHKYDADGKLIYSNLKLALDQTNWTYDYEYDNQNRLIQRKLVDLNTGDSNITRYEYDTQGDTVVKYGITNGDVSSIEKTITNSGIFEHYSYILPEFKLYYYEKKIMTDENNYIKIEGSVGSYVDSTFVEEGRKVKYVNAFENLIFTNIYEYDSLNNLKKEIHYTKYLE